jgi:acid phosphatase
MNFMIRLSTASALVLFAASVCSFRGQRKIPRPDHIVIVIEENHNYEQIIGSSNAPFINSIARDAAVFTDAHGEMHPSQPNYLALFSGSFQGVTGDKCLKALTPFSTPNLGAALVSAGFSFKGFAEDMPSPGFLDCEHGVSPLTHDYLYARKHAPWVNWQGNKVNNIPAELSQPMTAFPQDYSRLPDVAFVVPNMDNDMHNIGDPGDAAAVQRGDAWLKKNLSDYIRWAKTHNSLLILTFDEDEFTPKNHMLTLFAGARVRAGEYSEPINHFNILHTLEAMYDLPVTDSSKAVPVTDIWRK